MDLSAFVGAVVYTTKLQGNWEQSHLSVHLVIGIQTSVPAVDPAVAHELSPAPLGCGLGIPGEHCLIQSSTHKTAFGVGPEKDFQHITGAKNIQV